jgi:hypothetical protein
MEKGKAINFHVSEDFEFEVGAKRTNVKVPRMKFATGNRVILRIAEIQASDVETAMKLLLQAKSGNKSIVADVKSMVKKVVEGKNVNLIKELLSIISEGSLTDKIVSESECQYDEVISILDFLINANFGSLKNLSASLEAISSSGQ